MLDCIALLSAYACYGHYRHNRDEMIDRHSNSVLNYHVVWNNGPALLDIHCDLLGYYSVRLHLFYLAIAMVRQFGTLPQLDAYVLDAVRHSLRSSTLPPKALPFLSEKSQHAYIECSLSAKDAKEAGGDDFLAMYLHMLLLEMLPGDTSLSAREMIVATLCHDDTLCLAFGHLMKPYEEPASSVINETPSLTGDSFGKAMKRMIAQCSLDGEKDDECRIEHMRKWAEGVFRLPAMEAIAAYNRHKCLERISRKENRAKYDHPIHPSLPNRPLPLTLTNSAKFRPRDKLALSQNVVNKQVRRRESLNALRASPMATTPNKRHLSDVNNDPYISNKRPRKKRSSLPSWRDDMKENIPPMLSRRTSQAQDPYPYTTSAATSGRDLVKRGRYSSALVLPLPDTDVKPIIKANGLLLLPRNANVLCVSL
ncbi:uncharacterized protein ARMOST_07997 [Armillaria ostoyae]|uniref:Uncharacterized protein n=1 Tax=Armillaria ostoyae TaxID=47428 RepID=A0A284R7H4_ARMOS|nr:uncharacterized protein ARMOST_07997 [Armillaria ostoyae]